MNEKPLSAVMPVMSIPVQRERLLRLPQVEDATGLKKTSIYTLMNEGKFPQRVRINRRMSVWPESQVMQWVQDRIHGKHTT